MSGAVQLSGWIQDPQEQIPQHPVQIWSCTVQAVAEILCTKFVKSCQDWGWNTFAVFPPAQSNSCCVQIC
jgi:hypothetical protein